MKNILNDKSAWVQKTSIAFVFISSAIIVANVFQINLFDITKAIILAAVGYFMFIGRNIDHKVDFEHK